MSTSKIEWTDKTWNPVTGCTKVSQGCKHCYAETFYERFNGKGSFRNITCHPDRLLMPMRWKKPSMVFVNSMSDLFHEKVPFEFIDQVFAIMGFCQQHTFQVLTKRADRMLEYFRKERMHYWRQVALKLKGCFPPHFEHGSSFPNVWLGVSAEDQKTAAERIPYLLDVPAAVRFVSCEPLLGPINLAHLSADSARHPEYCQINALTGRHTDMARPCADVNKIDWVIVGGESGHGARPMYPDWVRSIRKQCETARTVFFFKQWGTWSFDDTGNMQRMGKHRSGRLLDGQEYQQFPLTQPHSITKK